MSYLYDKLCDLSHATIRLFSKPEMYAAILTLITMYGVAVYKAHGILTGMIADGWTSDLGEIPEDVLAASFGLAWALMSQFLLYAAVSGFVYCFYMLAILQIKYRLHFGIWMFLDPDIKEIRERNREDTI